MLFDEEYMKPLFELLEQTKGVEQMAKHHPEGDVFIHSLQTMRCAFRETDDTDLILAAMLHDIGKKELRSGHEAIAVEWLEPHTSVKTLWLIKNHMRVWTYLLGDMRKLSKCSTLVGHAWFPELIQLARWDKMGRRPNYVPSYDKTTIMDMLNGKAERYFKNPLTL